MIGILSRLLAAVLLLTISALAQTHAGRPLPHPRPAPTAPRWYIFAGPDRDFVVEFPSAPKRMSDNEAPGGTARNYVLVKDGLTFRLHFIDTGLDPGSREGNQLPLDFRREMLEHARERGWTVVRAELVHRNVYEQETWSPMKSNAAGSLHYIERDVVRHGRQYILTCASLIPDKKADASLCRRFLDSFRVTGEPQPQ